MDIAAVCFRQSNAFESTGWRRPIGCLKLQVILRQRASNDTALSQKMSCKDHASYGSWPPCMNVFFQMPPFATAACLF